MSSTRPTKATKGRLKNMNPQEKKRKLQAIDQILADYAEASDESDPQPAPSISKSQLYDRSKPLVFGTPTKNRKFPSMMGWGKLLVLLVLAWNAVVYYDRFGEHVQGEEGPVEVLRSKIKEIPPLTEYLANLDFGYGSGSETSGTSASSSSQTKPSPSAQKSSLGWFQRAPKSSSADIITNLHYTKKIGGYRIVQARASKLKSTLSAAQYYIGTLIPKAPSSSSKSSRKVWDTRIGLTQEKHSEWATQIVRFFNCAQHRIHTTRKDVQTLANVAAPETSVQVEIPQKFRLMTQGDVDELDALIAQTVDLREQLENTLEGMRSVATSLTNKDQKTWKQDLLLEDEDFWTKALRPYSQHFPNRGIFDVLPCIAASAYGEFRAAVNTLKDLEKDFEGFREEVEGFVGQLREMKVEKTAREYLAALEDSEAMFGEVQTMAAEMEKVNPDPVEALGCS